MRQLLTGVVATVFALLAGGETRACDGCEKGGSAAPPPPAFAPGLSAAPALPATGFQERGSFQERGGPCPCGVGRRGGRGMPAYAPAAPGGGCPCAAAGYAPYGPNPAEPYGRAAAPSSPNFGCSSCPGRDASFEAPRGYGYNPVPPQPAVTFRGEPTAPAPSQASGYSTRYYTPDAPALAAGTDQRFLQRR